MTHVYKCQDRLTFHVDSTYFCNVNLSLFFCFFVNIPGDRTKQGIETSVLAQIELIFVTVETPLCPTTRIHEI